MFAKTIYMKNLILLAFILLSFTDLNSQEKQNIKDRGYHVKVGDFVESFDMKLTSGEEISLSGFSGKVVVLQFTASWCSVCRKEMPALESEIWQEFKDKEFILIGVDLDEPLDKVIEFKQKMKTTYPMALDPGGEIFQRFAYKGSGVTRNVVIDQEGNIAFLTRLYDHAEFNAMKSKIVELLGK